MEPPLGSIRQASFLGDRNEVPQVTELHPEPSILLRYGLSI
jgi:hypothetical protein